MFSQYLRSFDSFVIIPFILLLAIHSSSSRSAECGIQKKTVLIVQSCLKSTTHALFVQFFGCMLELGVLWNECASYPPRCSAQGGKAVLTTETPGT